MDEKWIPSYYLKPSYYWDYYKNSNRESYKDEAEKQDERNSKIVERYRTAPEPKVIQIDESEDGVTSSLHYEVGVVFDKNTLTKPTTCFNKFDPKNHSLTLWRWHAKAVVEPYPHGGKYDPDYGCTIPNVVYNYPDGGYYKWLKHKRSKPTKWEKLTENPRDMRYTRNDRVILAHLFFKTEEDFMNWMGKENYATMFTDLLK